MDEPEAMPLPTAYCAPGRKVISELALVLKGERYAEMIEHPWLEGITDVWLVSPDVGHWDFPPMPLLSGGCSLLPWYQVPVLPLSSPLVLFAGI